MLTALHAGCLALLFVSVVLVYTALARVPVPMAVRLGYQGVQRRRALHNGGFFPTLEPIMRFVAGLLSSSSVAPLLKKLRARQEKALLQADYYLGLTPDELSALCLISSVGLGASSFGISAGILGLEGVAAQKSCVLGLLGAAFGLFIPVLQLQEVIRSRMKVIARGLPHAIEVVAMCMGAGLDFPGALRQLTTDKQGEGDALSRELSVILEQLQLGHTRKVALRHFAERVPSDAVRDFVNAVVQAEEKGNPLAHVIQVQGRILSQRRSVAAEEAAARAGVMMILPMMILVTCILLLLLGPFMVKGVGF